VLKKTVLLSGLGILILLAALPIGNLLLSRPASEPVFAGSNNPYARQAGEIFAQKCMDCHSTKTNYPFYFSLPIAKQIIRKDIEAGLSAYDLTPVLSGQEVRENHLAKLEVVLADGSMPPLRYRALHWNAELTKKDKETLLAWIREERKKSAGKLALWNEPVRPITRISNLNPQKVELGFKLFHDTRLSGDNTLSCASCHDLKKGGTDRAPVATGIFGQKGGINAPTVYNAANNFVQFWDGRAADLREQAEGPVANPVEMGAKWEDVVVKIKQDPQYAAVFRALYPDGVTKHNITDAIATFEKTLMTPNSRFDRYLAGDSKALTDAEKRGYDLFKLVGCASCHMGPNLGGMTFEKMGRKVDYFKERGGLLTEADNGRFNVTHREIDRHKFKVPTLRNIAQTAPYFHDASTSDLKEAVRVMARVQLGKKLDERQTEEIAQFLQTLTGEYQGKPVQ
jgi:cytochrome c peroxidase